ncbi:hypothetical protein GCM10025858_07860 [Alicyclobacillus sacchari]|nr:hypothetical protein GCM10025858_07860 [Alicyclobacillus sacchari]
MRVDEFDYYLPEHLIAQEPLPERDQSRLLVVDPVAQRVWHRQFADIVEELHPGDVLVMNDSRVLPARLYARKSATGAQVEVLLLRPSESDAHTWFALARLPSGCAKERRSRSAKAKMPSKLKWLRRAKRVFAKFDS